MKKSLIALAVLGATSGLAQAQSAPSWTVYGNLDAGLMTQDHSTNNNGSSGPRGTASAFVDGQMEPTLVGVKGGRDLGDGLKAGFTLEAGFSLGNGQHNNPGAVESGTSVFSREANIHLSGNWGKATFGQQIDPAFIASLGTEPRGMTDSFSMLNQWIGATAFNGTTPTPGTNGMISANSPTNYAYGNLTGGLIDVNSVSYTYANNGLYLGMQYGFGGIAGSSSANSTESIGAAYSNSGFTVSGGYARANSDATTGITGKSSEVTNFGLGYANGPFAARAQYGEYKSNAFVAFGVVPLRAGTFSNDVKTTGIGFDYATSPKNKLNLSYYTSKDAAAGFGGKSTLVALMDKYELFKMTHLYAQVASTNVDTNAGLSADIGGIYNSTGQLLANTGKTTYFGAGLIYAF